MFVVVRFRSTSVPVRHVPKSLQAQAPPYRAQTPAQWRETVPVPKVSETLLPLGFLQSAHEPSLLLLPTLPGKLLKRDTHKFTR